MKRCILLLLLALALFVPVGFACAESGIAILSLPADLETIEEEAFYGTQLSHVIVPEGVISIGARAFAYSGLASVELPESLTEIDDSAFEGCGTIHVYAPYGSFAYDWAVEKGYILPLRADLVCENTNLQVGAMAAWTVLPFGGRAPYAFSFTLYLDETPVESLDYDDAAEHTFTFLQEGVYHVVAEVIDADGETASIESEIFTVAAGPIRIFSLATQESPLLTGETRSWTTLAIGGQGGYQYRYELFSGTNMVYQRSYSSEDTFYYTFFEAGQYTLNVYAKDSAGDISEVFSQVFTVDASEGLLTARIRIYVDCYSDGTIWRSNNKTGHYDLQIVNNNSSSGFSFDNYVYDSPVFYYGSGARGVISVFEGTYVPRANVQLYTLDFFTTARQVKDFMYDKLRDYYLDTQSEAVYAEGVTYNVIKGDFTSYVIKKTNCFAATAHFCRWLGYDKLYEIYQKAGETYTDYIAWKLYDKYKSSWNYVGWFPG